MSQKSSKPAHLMKNNKSAPVANVTKVQHFSGPLPPPETLQGFENIYPGSCKIIFQMAQQSSQNQSDIIANERLKLETVASIEQQKLKEISLQRIIFTVIVCTVLFVIITCILASVYFFYIENMIAGIAFLSPAVVVSAIKLLIKNN